jgi:hypothetical protein
MELDPYWTCSLMGYFVDIYVGAWANNHLADENLGEVLVSPCTRTNEIRV